jgi:hypothetical protein
MTRQIEVKKFVDTVAAVGHVVEKKTVMALTTTVILHSDGQED